MEQLEKLWILKEGDEEDIVSVELENGKIVSVEPHTWEIFKFSLENNQIVSDTVGTFTQYPLRLALLSLSTNQGKTFEKVIIDIGRGTFAHGQMYVALSRCTSMEGLVLRQPIKSAHIRLDYAVVKFHQIPVSSGRKNLSLKIEYR